MKQSQLGSTPLRAEYFETAHPKSIVQWCADTLGKVAVVTSFQSSGLVILHMARSAGLRFPVLFLETGFHFRETLELRDRLVGEWELDLIELKGRHGSVDEQDALYGTELYRREPDLCCRINKIEPLYEALEGFDGWISGVRRDQSDQRGRIPVAHTHLLPSGGEILKVNPLACWRERDVHAYLDRYDIPTNPLLQGGYPSIGCWPCTRAISEGEHPRDGRWQGTEKTECGIHPVAHVQSPSA